MKILIHAQCAYPVKIGFFSTRHCLKPATTLAPGICSYALCDEHAEKLKKNYPARLKEANVAHAECVEDAYGEG